MRQVFEAQAFHVFPVFVDFLFALILWMDEILHNPRNPAMIRFPCKYRHFGFNHGFISCEMDFVHQYDQSFSGLQWYVETILGVASTFFSTIVLLKTDRCFFPGFLI